MRRACQPGEELLRVEGLTKRFGGLLAVHDVSLTLRAGEIVGLIGPNGAGKTTVFNLVTGMDQPDAGSVLFDRRDITRLAPHRISRLGVARTFQNIRLLGHLSVLDNVKIAYHKHVRYNLAQAVLRSRAFRRQEREIARRAMGYLHLFDLQDLADEPASALPYGRRRNLEIARALATEGTLLLLDEPAAGLNEQETAQLADRIRRIRDDCGVTILLIEHDMKMVMNVCQRVAVLDHGSLIALGTPEEIGRDQRVVEAYLGRPAGNGPDGSDGKTSDGGTSARQSSGAEGSAPGRDRRADGAPADADQTRRRPGDAS